MTINNSIAIAIALQTKCLWILYFHLYENLGLTLLRSKQIIKFINKFQPILFIDSIMLNDNKKDNKDYTLLDGLYVPGSILTLQVHDHT